MQDAIALYKATNAIYLVRLKRMKRTIANAQQSRCKHRSAFDYCNIALHSIFPHPAITPLV